MVTAMQPDQDPSDNRATAMTSAAAPEICDNCTDGDGGLIDAADPDCCRQTGTLTLARVTLARAKIRPRGGNTGDAKLRITGILS
jgi:hypothetical protein